MVDAREAKTAGALFYQQAEWKELMSYKADAKSHRATP